MSDWLWSPYSDMGRNADFFPLDWSADSAPVLSELEILQDTSFSENEMDDDTFTEIFNELEFLIQPSEIPPIMEDNQGIADETYAAIVNVANPETSLVSRRPASVRCKWPNFVWLICACNRLSHAAVAATTSLRAKVPHSPGTVLKGVMKKKDKYVCEMRVMMKMQKEKNKLLPKVWLGTYKTQAQAARALDVGKFFFNSKEIKSFSNPNSEDILSKLSFLLAQPLEELVANVKKLAKHYGENGSLQNFVL